MDYAAIADTMGCLGLRVEDPDRIADAIREGLANTSTPTVVDVIVTRDPAKMLPGVDNRTLKVERATDRVTVPCGAMRPNPNCPAPFPAGLPRPMLRKGRRRCPS
jgi:hypothetical protein